MKHFKSDTEKQNIFKAYFRTKEKSCVEFVGLSKSVILACTALILVSLFSAVSFTNQDTDTNMSKQYSDIVYLAEKKLNNEDFGGAIKLFEEAIKINPLNEELYISLADSYNGANETDKARETLEAGYNETKSNNIKTKLTELDNANLSEKINRLLGFGKNALNAKDYDLALKNALEIIKLDPMSIDGYLLASDSYTNYEKAINILERGFKLTGNNKLKSHIDELKASKKEISNSNNSENSENSENSKIPIKNVEPDKIIKLVTHSEENSYKIKDTIVFKSTANWFELNEQEDSNGATIINSNINNILDKYFKFSLSAYGADKDDELYNIVKESGKIIETKISIIVTYNKNDIISYSINLNVSTPEGFEAVNSVELHNVNIKTGEELNLSDILSGNENEIKKIIIDTYLKLGIKLSESEYSYIKFYLNKDNLVLISSSNKAYIPFSESDKFLIPYLVAETSKSESEATSTLQNN